MHILGVIPFTKLQHLNNSQTVKNDEKWDGELTLICFWLSYVVWIISLLFKCHTVAG